MGRFERWTLRACRRVLQARPVDTGVVDGPVLAVRCATVNFFIYRSGSNTICFDSGFGKAAVLKGFQTLGIDSASVSHVFLTHSDFDHAGGLAFLSNAAVYLSQDEVPMITHQKARMFHYIYNNKISEYNELKDSEIILVGSVTIRAIKTPGHTPGSMSYLVDGRFLFSGDTFKLENGLVYPLRNYINMDTKLQMQSIAKLARLDGVRLACAAHSGCTLDFPKATTHWMRV